MTQSTHRQWGNLHLHFIRAHQGSSLTLLLPFQHPRATATGSTGSGKPSKACKDKKNPIQASKSSEPHDQLLRFRIGSHGSKVRTESGRERPCRRLLPSRATFLPARPAVRLIYLFYLHGWNAEPVSAPAARMTGWSHRRALLRFCQRDIGTKTSDLGILRMCGYKQCFTGSFCLDVFVCVV